jgi:hypothetical protein
LSVFVPVMTVAAGDSFFAVATGRSPFKEHDKIVLSDFHGPAWRKVKLPPGWIGVL